MHGCKEHRDLYHNCEIRDVWVKGLVAQTELYNSYNESALIL